MLAWRSNPDIYQGFYTQNSPLSWEGHVKWFRSRNQDWRTFVILGDLRPVGVVTIGQLDHWSPEIGYYIGEESLWGKGIATQSVKTGMEWLRAYATMHPHIVGVHTTILDRNSASIKVVKNLGFKKGMPARDGETYWQRLL